MLYPILNSTAVQEEPLAYILYTPLQLEKLFFHQVQNCGHSLEVPKKTWPLSPDREVPFAVVI